MAIDWSINDPNPKRQVTREEHKKLFDSCKTRVEYDLTTRLNDTGRRALYRFLTGYVKYDCGIGAWLLWVDRMDKIAQRHILLHYDGNLYAKKNESASGEEIGMIVKWFYFDWFVQKNLNKKYGPLTRPPDDRK